MIRRSICFGLKDKPEDRKIRIVDGEATVADTAGGCLLHERHKLLMISNVDTQDLVSL